MEAVWDDVIKDLDIEDKHSLLSKLIKACTPSDYLKMTPTLQEMVCIGLGIEGWHDVLSQKISDVNTGLPSPSNMTWSDVSKIMIGNIPKYSDELTRNLMSITDEEKENLLSQFQMVEDCFDTNSEMDATCRVVIVLAALLSSIPMERRCNYKVHCQPTIAGHAVFIDCLVRVSNGEKHLIIEVKKQTINIGLSLRSSETAQVLREVHIAMNTKQLKEIPFLLTNSRGWSFGKAERVDSKINVTSATHFDLQVDPNSLISIYRLIKTFLLQ